MMNQPKPYQNHARITNSCQAEATCKSDGTGFDVESILGRTGSVLVVGTTGEDFDDGGR